MTRASDKSFFAHLFVVLAAAFAWLGPAEARAKGRKNEDIPAEVQRLDSRVFRAGLKKRGLREVLEQHIREFPPTDLVTSLLMMRDVHLTAWSDQSLTPPVRAEALRKANEILAELLQQSGDDPRRFKWRFDLAHSLLYGEAESFFTRILYLGGNAEDHVELGRITSRALAHVERLTAELSAEYERIDKLKVPEFDRLERGGFIEEIDRLVPQADYLLMWTLYYDALSHDARSPQRAARLGRILELFDQNPAMLTEPHKTSHVQVQALLLEGMTHRLHNNHAAAREALNRSLAVADGIGDAEEQQRIAWAKRVARIEVVRNETNDKRYDEALRGLKAFRRVVVNGAEHVDGSAVVAGLLERWHYRERSMAAQLSNRPVEANSYRKKSWESLARLVELQSHRRDEIYSTLYGLIDPGADPKLLDPLEHAALVAGLLADAQDAAAGGEALLERVVEVGQAYLELRAEQEPRFVPEVLFNLGVAEHRLGRLGGAAKRFLEVATRFPNFEQGARSAVIAVQLAEQQYRRAPDDESGKSLYGDCLAALVDGFPDTEDARYHRFFYAQLLEESKRYDEAADQYAVIESGHEHHLLSTFRHIRCRALGLGVLARSDQTDSLEIQRRVNEFLSARRHFVTVATGAKGQQAVMTPEQLDRLSATAEVIEAEVLVLPAVNRSGQAILALERFEESHPGQSALTARVWRVRVLAYKRLDRLEEAAQALPAYVQADPDGAGETLQALYESVAQDADALAVATETERAMAKAQTALLLAEQIDTWARQSDAGPQDGLLRAVTVQLAEANLRAQHYPKARELFESFLGVADGRAPQAALIDARTRFGYAESLYHLGEFTQALPHFNHLAVRLPMDDSLRWKSLLRDLQCRTALGEPAEGIVRVIRQQQFLDSRLGGPVLSPKFLALLRENERR